MFPYFKRIPVFLVCLVLGGMSKKLSPDIEAMPPGKIDRGRGLLRHETDNEDDENPDDEHDADDEHYVDDEPSRAVDDDKHDVDDDDDIEKDSVANFIKGITNTKEIRKALKFLLKKVDANGDQKVSKEEILNYMHSKGSDKHWKETQKTAHLIVSEFDVDGDGEIGTKDIEELDDSELQELDRVSGASNAHSEHGVRREASRGRGESLLELGTKGRDAQKNDEGSGDIGRVQEVTAAPDPQTNVMNQGSGDPASVQVVTAAPDPQTNVMNQDTVTGVKDKSPTPEDTVKAMKDGTSLQPKDDPAPADPVLQDADDDSSEHPEVKAVADHKKLPVRQTPDQDDRENSIQSGVDDKTNEEVKAVADHKKLPVRQTPDQDNRENSIQSEVDDKTNEEVKAVADEADGSLLMQIEEHHGNTPTVNDDAGEQATRSFPNSLDLALPEYHDPRVPENEPDDRLAPKPLLQPKVTHVSGDGTVSASDVHAGAFANVFPAFR